MKEKLIRNREEQVYVLVFDKGDAVMEGLSKFAETHRLAAAQLTGIGGFQDVSLGFFEPDRKGYKAIPVREQVEVLSLTGNIALHQGAPKVHAHVVVGKADGTAHGGHLLEGHVWPTLEIVVTESPRHLQRRTDPETGLPLIRL
ncbi:PPC domain-containing DNA-binding protein [Candidatus Manganitrophus noduliformans]|uniref:DNA-binding protein n=1 Tax=Candidatus Manganitrophus noduliformans TaxID=2606439 RepID=A0A7X6DP51_9BACT|nr:PPC domain-containing DNA-binding protein [Candidatus Manganitrophus noduliformans]NKE70775.1 DNA-binding protein [Candidatus Manganitrophus noduliformans]